MATDDGSQALHDVVRRHWTASESGDDVAEHEMYADDALLGYPQSGERFRGRATIAAQTQYFADLFAAPESRAAFVEPV